jgi:hypothetical protein
VPRPGEGSRAHHGILFLDEQPEFRRLEVRCQALEADLPERRSPGAPCSPRAGRPRAPAPSAHTSVRPGAQRPPLAAGRDASFGEGTSCRAWAILAYPARRGPPPRRPAAAMTVVPRWHVSCPVCKRLRPAGPGRAMHHHGLGTHRGRSGREEIRGLRSLRSRAARFGSRTYAKGAQP